MIDTDFIMIILGLLFSGSGVYAVGIIWIKQDKVKRSQRWPSVQGEVVESEVRKESRIMANHTPLTTFHARIRYRYVVGGSAYESDTICLGGELNTSMMGRAEERCFQYPVGALVTVYYDPRDPRSSCLEKKGELTWFVYGIGLVFLVVGIWLLARS